MWQSKVKTFTPKDFPSVTASGIDGRLNEFINEMGVDNWEPYSISEGPNNPREWYVTVYFKRWVAED